MKLKIKEGASLQGLQLPMRYVLQQAAQVWSDYGQQLVVTSGTDGEHLPSSLHYYGYAVDLRTRYFTDEIKKKVFTDLCFRLHNKGYIVILHNTHIHVEYRKIIDKQE